MKKVIAILSAVILAFLPACGKSEISTQNPEDTKYSSKGDYYILEYKKDLIPEGAAKSVEKYFHAIEKEDESEYKASLYDPYEKQMEKLLKKKGKKGISDLMSELDSALKYYTGQNLNGEDDSYKITGITLKPGTEEDVNTHLEQYSNNFGKDFTDDLKKDTKSIFDIYFTLHAEDSEGNEGTLLENNELLVVQDKDGYFVIG